MKKTKVIAGFPGIGKTTYAEDHPDLIIYDSDSSQFPKDETWPQNYIEHIQSKIGKADIVFTSTHDIVLKAMKDAEIDFAVFIPAQHQRKTWVEKRIQSRTTGLNNEKFCNLIRDNMVDWLEALEDSDYEVFSVWSIELGLIAMDAEGWEKPFGVCPFCSKPFELQLCDAEGNWRSDSSYLYEPWSGLGFQVTHNQGDEDCPIQTDEESQETIGNFQWDFAQKAREAFKWK